ncbi:DNA-binding transcriptional LysR family regulator [Paraburkholderia youngii]
MALPQAPIRGLSIEKWRRDPVVAFMPAGWPCPARITPQWIAAKPLILNDATTQLSRLTTEWFSAAGQHPTPRIQLNYSDAIKSLVAAGYGAALLPQEAGRSTADTRIVTRPLRPALWRQLGLAFRAGTVERPTQYVLDVLRSLRLS